MSTEVAIPEEVSTDIVNIEHLDTPEKRFSHLSRSFTSAIVVIAEMQNKRDWENLTRDDGSPYKSLTDMVQDALKISDSYARRLVQTATVFYTPLEAVTVEGTVINITAGEAAKLGGDGMAEITKQVSEQIEGNDDPEFQSELIDAVKGDVLSKKNAAKLDDFDDDFLDGEFDDFDFDDDDFGDDDLPPAKASASKKPAGDSSASDFEDSDDFGDFDDDPPAPELKDKKKDKSKQTPSDYLGPIEKIMSGGKEYKTDEDIEELPEELQEFVRAVNYLANLDSVGLSEMITEDRRGVTYSIRKAASNLTLVVSATETSSWVLEQI